MTAKESQLKTAIKLAVGDYITVERWTSHTDNSYVGAILEVECIDGSLILCRPIKRYLPESLVLDQNRLVIRKLTTLFGDQCKKKLRGRE